MRQGKSGERGITHNPIGYQVMIHINTMKKNEAKKIHIDFNISSFDSNT